MAHPSPTRTFTTELAPAGSPRTNVGYHYIGTQSTPMAGLAPARHAAVWAANGDHGDHGDREEDSGGKDSGPLYGWRSPRSWWENPFLLRTTILQNVVLHARFSSLLNISCGHLRSYVSRQDAKGAKVDNTAILSSWRSWRLCARTGFGCGRRPRWALRGSNLLVPTEGRAGFIRVHQRFQEFPVAPQRHRVQREET